MSNRELQYINGDSKSTRYSYLNDKKQIGKVTLEEHFEKVNLSYSFEKDIDEDDEINYLLGFVKQEVKKRFPDAKKLAIKVELEDEIAQERFKKLNFEEYQVMEKIIHD